MTTPHDIVFLLDVDNTLLDNDQVIADLHRHLEQSFGAATAQRYWTIFEALRTELGYADYLGALQRYRSDAELELRNDTHLLQMSSFLIDYPFAERLYPHAIEAIGRLNAFGPTVILSDGDVVFQPRKVQRSGLWGAVSGRVLIYVHKEQMLDSVQRHYPARHYVMIDDKLRILAAMKKIMADRLTTLFVKQGHYAVDPAEVAAYPAADFSIQSIGDLLGFDVLRLLRPQGIALASQEKP
jgi:FMN phosphatase YigB (HAD superfamily)